MTRICPYIGMGLPRKTTHALLGLWFLSSLIEKRHILDILHRRHLEIQETAVANGLGM